MNQQKRQEDNLKLGTASKVSENTMCRRKRVWLCIWVKVAYTEGPKKTFSKSIQNIGTLKLKGTRNQGQAQLNNLPEVTELATDLR